MGRGSARLLYWTERDKERERERETDRGGGGGGQQGEQQWGQAEELSQHMQGITRASLPINAARRRQRTTTFILVLSCRKQSLGPSP